jgi:hypothetical protein
MSKQWFLLFGIMIAVQGRVVSFDANWVKLAREDGRQVYVPRSSVVGDGALKENAAVNAEFSIQEFARRVDSWPGKKTITIEAPSAKPRKP